MKLKHTRTSRYGAIVLAAALTTGAATAAVTSSKGGMETSTAIQQQTTNYDGLPMLAPGVQELRLGGALNWENETAYNFDISYGRFLTSNWQVGGYAGITGINSDKDFRVGVFGEYNFLTGTKWVPFIRANVGYFNPDIGDDSVILGANFGVKYFMRSNLAIFASIGGDWVLSGDDDRDDGFTKQIDLGLNFYF